VAQIAPEIRKASLELQIQRQVDERVAKAGPLRIVTAIRRDIGIEIFGRRRRTNENEAIMVIRAMQDLARDRGKERLGALGLPMVDQQSDEMQLDAVPQRVKLPPASPAERNSRSTRSTVLAAAVKSMRSRRMNREPPARLEIALGCARTVAKQTWAG
jgi:hypothetical protein